MPRPAIAIAALGCLIAFGVVALEPATEQDAASTPQAVVIRGHTGDVLARVALPGDNFAVSYRNSIYGTLAEERYVVSPDERYRLVQIAADQLAVLEEYYAVPGPPRRAEPADRRTWVVPPDPAHPAVFEELSIAATDLGQRTLHVPGSPPLALWRLVEDNHPFVVLAIEETP
ncbi:hypothetical protein SAMN05661010_01560 [Modicisalibacter muralis]|uniref:Uncharacterized protein n=1 Tax=Modicisalibacter muralis TaxID=119000 RepID=A0A1G9JQ08_9GAMM|nr:hypothetical protein [Halomonas muralis]SDL39402.1 hypothetical protein SAMN05661010_01560 [Halomonas muralis]